MQKQVCSYLLMVHKKLQSLSGVNYVIKTQKSNSFSLMLLRFTLLHSIIGELRGLAGRETETHTESFASVTGDCAGQSFYSWNRIWLFVELLFGHRFVCWKLFLESWSKLAQPLCWKQCLGVPFQCVFAHNSFFCYFMSAVSTLSFCASLDCLQCLCPPLICWRFCLIFLFAPLYLSLLQMEAPLSLSHTHTEVCFSL